MSRRVALRSPARLQWPGHDVACDAESLDIRGVRCLVPTLDPDKVPGVGTSVRITITVDGALLPIGATVNYTCSREGGHIVGMLFEPLDEIQRSFLLAFIADADDAA